MGRLETEGNENQQVWSGSTCIIDSDITRTATDFMYPPTLPHNSNVLPLCPWKSFYMGAPYARLGHGSD
jgi:hypothetical protein